MQRRWLKPLAVLVPVALYIVFVAHFGRNGIYWDDWTVVPMVDGALHHHIVFETMWQQHNESRIFIPYLVMTTLGYATHLNTMAIVYASAAFFIASFVLLLGAYGRWAGKSSTPLQTLVLGIVWFAVLDIENSLWAFQLAWYMILFCLIAMLYVLSRPSLSNRAVAAALALAVVASFSSLQGLFLWPLGIACIAWRVRDRPRLALLSVAWVAAAVTTIVLYFRGFDFAATGGGSYGYAAHHPLPTIGLYLALIGDVFPTVHTDLLFHGIVGAVLLAMSVVVLVLTARSWRRTTVLPLPAALIVFALLVDASIAIGRVSLGTGRGTAVRYTMFNLLIPIALLITLFVIQEAKTYPTFSIVGAAVAIVVVLQAAMSTTVGFQEAGAWRARILTGNSIVVDLDRIPQPERTGVFNGYVFPSLQAVTALGWLTMVDQDRLGELSK